MTWLAFDKETTTKDFGSPLVAENRLVLTAWRPEGGVTCDAPPEAMGDFWRAVEEADVLVAQNAKFEAGWMHRMGYDPTGKVWWDTMLAEKLLLCGKSAPLNLGAMARRYGIPDKEEIIDRQFKAGVDTLDMSPRLVRARCRRDVRTTARIYLAQRKRAEALGLTRVIETRCLLTPILAVMEAAGMHLDRERVTDEYRVASEHLGQVRANLEKLVGGINLRSPAQKAHFFYGTLGLPEETDYKGRPRRGKPSKQFPDGVPKTDKAAVARLERLATTPEQLAFFALMREHAKLDARLSKNLEFFYGIVTERSPPIFHGVFNQHVTHTDRLSSSGRPQTFSLWTKAKSVQFQNMPRDLKRVFTARTPGWKMVEADGAQLEFRVAAFLGQDRQAMEDIRNPDFDVHVVSAAAMEEVPYDELLARVRAEDKVAVEMRRAAKSYSFKPLYGGTRGTEKEERWYKAFAERYKDLVQVQNEWMDQVLASGGTLVTPWGMRFHWDYEMVKRGREMVAIDRATKKQIRTMVCNYPVQALATAEIIPIALVALWRRVHRAGLRVLFVNTIHDSVVAEVHPDDVTSYVEAVQKAFTVDVFHYLRTRYGLRFNVPLGCGVKVGDYWGEGTEVSYTFDPEA